MDLINMVDAREPHPRQMHGHGIMRGINHIIYARICTCINERKRDAMRCHKHVVRDFRSPSTSLVQSQPLNGRITLTSLLLLFLLL